MPSPVDNHGDAVSHPCLALPSAERHFAHSRNAQHYQVLMWTQNKETFNHLVLRHDVVSNHLQVCHLRLLNISHAEGLRHRVLVRLLVMVCSVELSSISVPHAITRDLLNNAAAYMYDPTHFR